MWIFMKHTYAGGIGRFDKGIKYDLPPGVVELIPKDCYKKTCPHWEEKTDKKAVALADARADAQRAANKVGLLEQEVESAKAGIERLGHFVKQKVPELEQAKAEAAAFTKKAEAMAANVAKRKAKAKGKAEAEAKKQESENAGQTQGQEAGQNEPKGDNRKSEGQAVSTRQGA